MDDKASVQENVSVSFNDDVMDTHLLKLKDAVLRLKFLDYARLQEDISAQAEAAPLVDAPVCKCQCSG